MTPEEQMMLELAATIHAAVLKFGAATVALKEAEEVTVIPGLVTTSDPEKLVEKLLEAGWSDKQITRLLIAAGV